MRSRRSCTAQPLDDHGEDCNDRSRFRKNSYPMKEVLRGGAKLEIPGFVLVVRQICLNRVAPMGGRWKDKVRVNDRRVAMMSLLVMRVLSAFMQMEKGSQKKSQTEGPSSQSGERAAHCPIVDHVSREVNPVEMHRSKGGHHNERVCQV